MDYHEQKRNGGVLLIQRKIAHAGRSKLRGKYSTIFQDYKSVVFKQLPGSLKRLALSAIRFNLNIYISPEKQIHHTGA